MRVAHKTSRYGKLLISREWLFSVRPNIEAQKSVIAYLRFEVNFLPLAKFLEPDIPKAVFVKVNVLATLGPYGPVLLVVIDLGDIP